VMRHGFGRPGLSPYQGVTWVKDKSSDGGGRWRASYKGTYLGLHATVWRCRLKPEKPVLTVPGYSV